MKRRNLIDIIGRFQTRHALREEREMKNFHAPTYGAVVPGVPDKNGMPKNKIWTSLHGGLLAGGLHLSI